MHFGDVIAATKSIASAYERMFETELQASQTFLSKHFCSNCGITQFSVIITCDRCTSRFCSESCKETSLKQFHSIECQILLSRQVNDRIIPEYIIALRMTFKYYSAGLKVPSKPTSCFNWTDGGKTLKDELIAINGFRSVYGTVRRDQLSSVKGFLKSIPEYINIKDKKSFWKMYDSIVTKLFNNIVESSNRTVAYKIVIGNTGVIDNIDCLHGLFEHSCKPNVVVFRPPHLNENYYILLENVKAGQNLNIAYE